jgi:hypothetical protein
VPIVGLVETPVGIEFMTTAINAPKITINPIKINPTIAKNIHHLALSLKASTAKSFNVNLFWSSINNNVFWLVMFFLRAKARVLEAHWASSS